VLEGEHFVHLSLSQKKEDGNSFHAFDKFVSFHIKLIRVLRFRAKVVLCMACDKENHNSEPTEKPL
jgi:hypothetical protein